MELRILNSGKLDLISRIPFIKIAQPSRGLLLRILNQLKLLHLLNNNRVLQTMDILRQTILVVTLNRKLIHHITKIKKNQTTCENYNPYSPAHCGL